MQRIFVSQISSRSPDVAFRPFRPLRLVALLALLGCRAPGLAAAPLIGSTGGLLPDTGQTQCYDTAGSATSCPAAGQSAHGQDAQYAGNQPSYTDNGDGTITDNVTGLMWQQDPDRNGDGNIDATDKLSFAAAVAGASAYRLAGYGDWRLPNIKELYSLIDFSGATGTASPASSSVPGDAAPYIDTAKFLFAYGDTAAGDRYIDAQYWSSTAYVSRTMQGVGSPQGDPTTFGVNFADGRIKGYPQSTASSINKLYVRHVRGGNDYGANQFVANGDGTITDNASGLMWQQGDHGAVDWAGALAWCESLDDAGHDDWRLPNAKELQGLVDYTRSPDTTASAAIDPLFSVTVITDEGGSANYPFYWTSTTHRDGSNYAAYVAFGEALGCMNGVVTDVHGAGSQRSDPKTASGATLGCGSAPQGDVIRVNNYVRCVRTATSGSTAAVPASYDTSSQTLFLPAIDGGSLGLFQATLTLVNTVEWIFEVSSLDAIASASPITATFDQTTGILAIPAVQVGTTRYAVTLTLQGDAPGLRFQLLAVE